MLAKILLDPLLGHMRRAVPVYSGGHLDIQGPRMTFLCSISQNFFTRLIQLHHTFFGGGVGQETVLITKQPWRLIVSWDTAVDTKIFLWCSEFEG